MAKQELDWNMGKNRLNQVSIIVGKTRESYVITLQNRDEDSLGTYRNMLDALWREIRQYLIKNTDEDEDWEERAKIKISYNGFEDNKLVQEWLDYFQNRINDAGYENEIVKCLRKIDDKLQNIRQDVNLDIPRSTKYKGEEYISKGL